MTFLTPSGECLSTEHLIRNQALMPLAAQYTDSPLSTDVVQYRILACLKAGALGAPPPISQRRISSTSGLHPELKRQHALSVLKGANKIPDHSNGPKD